MRFTTALLATVACHHAATHPPVATVPPPVCTGERIATVTVTGAERALVPSLTVLEGTIDEPQRTDRIAAAAVDALHTRGYARATIAVSHEPCALTVAVELGTRYRISRIEFITDDAFSPASRLSALEDSLGTVNTIGGVFVADRLAPALERLQQRYRDAGWIEAEVYEPIVSFVGARISLRIPVRAGRRFKIGHIRAVGGGVASRLAVLDALGLHGGDWYDGSSLRSGVERARHQLERKLELRTNVSIERRVVDVEVEVRK